MLPCTHRQNIRHSKTGLTPALCVWHSWLYRTAVASLCIVFWSHRGISSISCLCAQLWSGLRRQVCALYSPEGGGGGCALFKQWPCCLHAVSGETLPPSTPQAAVETENDWWLSWSLSVGRLKGRREALLNEDLVVGRSIRKFFPSAHFGVMTLGLWWKPETFHGYTDDVNRDADAGCILNLCRGSSSHTPHPWNFTASPEKSCWGNLGWSVTSSRPHCVFSAGIICMIKSLWCPEI